MNHRNIPALTGIRILAAMAVYFSHLGSPAGMPAPIVTAMASGYCGVTIFFMLSGFVLTLSYFDKLATPSIGEIVRYVANRIGRIYPVYLTVLIFVYLRAPHGPGFGLHVLGVQAWSPSVPVAYGFNHPAWSVSVEFFLYACFPLIVLALRRVTRVRTLVVIGGVLVAVLVAVTWWFAATGRGDLPSVDARSAHRWLYSSPVARLVDFTIGVLTARCSVVAGQRRGTERSGPVVAVIGFVVLLAVMSNRAFYLSPWSWDVLYIGPALMVIWGLAVAPDGIPARLLSSRPIVKLGEASFAFYLIHLPAIEILHASWVGKLTVSSVALQAVYLAIILSFALGVHMLIEIPCRNLVRRFTQTNVENISTRHANTLLPHCVSD